MDTNFNLSRAEAQFVMLNLEKFIDRFTKETGRIVNDNAKHIITDILENKIGTPMKHLAHGSYIWFLSFIDMDNACIYRAKPCSRGDLPSPKEDAEKIGLKLFSELDDGTQCYECIRDMKEIDIHTSRVFSQNFYIAKGDLVVFNPHTEKLDVYGDDETREDNWYQIKPDSSPHKSILDEDYDW